MTIAAIYLRLSNDDGRAGESQSIEGQRQDCHAYAKRNGWEAVEFVDDGYSASKLDVTRPAYEQMLSAMAAGEVQAVVAAKQDRISRQVGQWNDFKTAAVLSRCAVHTVESGDLQLASDTGILNTDIRSAFSAFEARLIGSRSKRGLETSRAKGRWTNTATFGYRKGGTIDPEQAKWVRWAYDEILSGRGTARTVFEGFRANGVKTARDNEWYSVNTVIRMLRVPALAGLVTYRGEIVGEGEWEPIVSPEERDRLSAAISANATSVKGHGKRTPRKYILSGIALCGKPECDLKTMVAQNPGNGRNHYFACDSRKGGCGNRARGHDLDVIAITVANMFLNSQRGEASQEAEPFDNSEIDSVKTQIREVRALMVSGGMRAGDAAPVLRELNVRLDSLKADRAHHEQKAAEVQSWHQQMLERITSAEPAGIRTVLDNVVVLPNREGFIFESKQGQVHRVSRAEDTGAWLVVGSDQGASR